MKKDIRDSLLLDFYAGMLTSRQEEVMRLYIECDTSYSEIASMLGTTRQAVYDIVKVSMNLLQGYEEKLKCVERYLNNREKLLQCNKTLTKIRDEKQILELNNVIKDIESVLNNQ